VENYISFDYMKVVQL